MNTNSTPGRPLSIAHLVFGLIFGGIATLWLIANANDADLHDQAVGLPVVLIGAGIIGLIAALIGRRQTVRRYAATVIETSPQATSETSERTEDTIVLTDPKDES